jgi:hypothetical protein
MPRSAAAVSPASAGLSRLIRVLRYGWGGVVTAGRRVVLVNSESRRRTEI